MINKLKKFLFNIYKTIFHIVGFVLPKNKHIIMFESFLGKQYSDSPRAIYEYIKEHYPEFKMYWSVERKSMHLFKDLPVTPVRRFSIKWLFLMNRAKYWVSNSRLPLWIPKPEQTVYVQTWHGTPLKRLAVDMDEVHMPGTNTESYKKNFTIESAKWDFLISPNAYSTEIFKRAFCFNNEVLESGYPRNDYLFLQNNENEITRIKKSLNLPLDKKIILYAPTWRDNQFYGRGRYKFDIPLDLKQMKQELGEEYIVLLRMHYLVAEKIDLQNYSDFVFDASYHTDIRELYLIADMLITDYSSVFFDYANLKKPILFYVYDIEEYRDTLRGFYMDLETEAPGPLVKTTDELIKKIKKMKSGVEVTENLQAFYDKFCSLEDGRASERVVKKIFKHKE